MNRHLKERIEKDRLHEQCSEVAELVPANRIIHSRDVKRRSRRANDRPAALKTRTP